MTREVGTHSYMDAVIPKDLYETIIQYKDQYEQKEYYEKIELYFTYKKKTMAWHNRIFIPFLLSDDEKKELSCIELQEYYNKLEKDFMHETNSRVRRLSTQEEEKLTDEEYYMYLKELRIQDEASIIDNMPLVVRRLIHPLLSYGLKKDRISKQIEVVVLNKKIPKQIRKRPIIFVLTHVGRDDISVFNDAISKRHYTILSGDYESLHNNVEGLVSRINRVVFFDMCSKEDRATVINRVADVNKRDDILCSMEGAWNTTANKIILDIFNGMILSAIKNDTVILPVGIERFDSKFYGINVSGKFFDAKEYFNKKEATKENIIEASNEIRQMMAEAKFELYYSEKVTSRVTTTRHEIGDYTTYNRNFKKDILTGWTFTEASIKQKAFHNVQDPTSAFAYIKTKYEKLLHIYNYLSLHNCREEIDLEKKFILMYTDLQRDLKVTVYPDEIREYLLYVSNQINNKGYDTEMKDVYEKQKVKVRV